MSVDEPGKNNAAGCVDYSGRIESGSYRIDGADSHDHSVANGDSPAFDSGIFLVECQNLAIQNQNICLFLVGGSGCLHFFTSFP